MRKFDVDDFYEWYEPHILYSTMVEFISAYNDLVRTVEKLEIEVKELRKGERK